MNAPIATRKMLYISPNGEREGITLSIGAPHLSVDGDWACAVALDGFIADLNEIRGIDSWQAVELGMHHIAVMTKHYYELGWRFYWERGGEEAKPSELQRKSE